MITEGYYLSILILFCSSFDMVIKREKKLIREKQASLVHVCCLSFCFDFHYINEFSFNLKLKLSETNSH
jgi:hypothetical protein